jgi:hypothetical protein
MVSTYVIDLVINTRPKHEAHTVLVLQLKPSHCTRLVCESIVTRPFEIVCQCSRFSGMARHSHPIQPRPA